MAQEANDMHGQASNQVPGGDQHQHDFRIHHNRPNQQGNNDDRPRVQPLPDGKALEAGIPDSARLNAASSTTSASQAVDHRQSSSGTFQACTVAAIIPAAAGQGMPTKYLSPPGAIPWTLKRARRHAQQTTNARLTSHASCDMRCPWGRPVSTNTCVPHANARIAGAIPKLTTSASESNCFPNSVFVCVARAMKPSKASNKMAKPMARAALSRSVAPPLSVARTE